MNHDQKRIEQLYTQHYGHILDLALADKRLFPQDGERIAQSVAAHLDSYDGPLEPEPFRQWVEGIIAPAVARLSSFYELRTQYRRSVLKGVWQVLKTAKDLADSDNLAHTARYLADDVWLWVFEHIEELETGTAEISTRLHAKGFWKARAWKTARLRQRARTVDLDVALAGRDEHGKVFFDTSSQKEDTA